MSEQPILAVRDLRVRVRGTGGSELLHGVDMVVGKGERVGLVGESGSGKSILSLAAAGLLPEALEINGGDVAVLGTSLIGASDAVLTAMRGSSVAMIYQDPMSSLNPVQTVGRQIVEAITVHQRINRRVAMRQAVDLLAQVGVRSPEQNAHAYPHEFSGGMRQRVMIAMALACEPSLLLADEPTTALDVTTQAVILDLLDRLSRERGMGVLFVTHDLAVAASFCDRINVMSKGEIVESGPSTAVIESPQHTYTQLLLNSMCTFGSDPNVPLGLPHAFAGDVMRGDNRA